MDFGIVDRPLPPGFCSWLATQTLGKTVFDFPGEERLVIRNEGRDDRVADLATDMMESVSDGSEHPTTTAGLVECSLSVCEAHRRQVSRYQIEGSLRDALREYLGPDIDTHAGLRDVLGHDDADDPLEIGFPLRSVTIDDLCAEWGVAPPPPLSTPEERPTPTNGLRMALRHVADIVAERREPAWLLRNILERRVLAVLAGRRGSFKSFVALDWCLRSAAAGHKVVVLSGEGGGLDRRVDAWMRVHAPSTALASLHVVALERPIALNATETLLELRAAIDQSSPQPDLVVVDTYSKFAAGVDENDNTEVALFLANLSSALRDHYGATVLLVAHSGHGDAKRPRGASALMANPDAEYIVERPDPVGMLCTVTRERFKDTASLPALAYEARTVDLSRVDQYGDPVTSLVLVPTDAPPPKPKGNWGRLQIVALTALREWSRAHPEARHIPTAELNSLLKAQGISSKRRHEVINSLINARVLSASIGGYTFDPAAL